MAGYIIYSLDTDKFRQFVEGPSKDQLKAVARLLRDGFEENDGEFDEDDPVLAWNADKKALVAAAAKRLALPDWYGDLSNPGKTLWEGVIFGGCMNDEFDVGFQADSDGIYWDVIELAWKKLGVVPNSAATVALSAFGTRPFRYHPSGKSGVTREEYDRDADDRRASLGALTQMLGQFLEGAKKGEKDPSKLLDELDEAEGVTREHKNLIKGFMNDDDDEEDEDDDEPWSPMHSMHAPEEVQKMLTELRSVEAAVKSSKSENVVQDYDELVSALEGVVSDGRILFIQVDT